MRSETCHICAQSLSEGPWERYGLFGQHRAHVACRGIAHLIAFLVLAALLVIVWIER